MPGTSQSIGIAYSSANDWIFVADYTGKKIYVFSVGGKLLTSWTVRGRPYALEVDSVGFLFLTDPEYFCFEKYTPDGRLICRVGSQGGAADQFRRPYGICLDSSNNVLVLDNVKGHVQRFK